MFGIGWMEIILIMAIALVVLGPTRMLETARLLGKTLGALRRTTEDFTTALSLTEEDMRSSVRKGNGQQDIAPGPDGSLPRDGDTTEPK